MDSFSHVGADAVVTPPDLVEGFPARQTEGPGEGVDGKARMFDHFAKPFPVGIGRFLHGSLFTGLENSARDSVAKKQICLVQGEKRRRGVNLLP